MKKILLMTIFLGACSKAQPVDSIGPMDGVVYSAAVRLGLNENENRQELKSFLGIDPVYYEWCAAFVNSVLNENDIPGSESVSDYPLTARSFTNWGYRTRIPERGDIVVFPRGNQGWQGHVGFYVKTVMVDGKEMYMILGGNQSDEVSFELFPASSAITIRRRPMESVRELNPATIDDTTPWYRLPLASLH